ncbi:MAG: hypothetical protein AB8I08_19280 [Sandaracinaceae bacterium]
MTRLRLGDMLVNAGMVTPSQVDEALREQQASGGRLGENLVRLGYLDESQMTQVLSNQLSLPWVNLHHIEFSRDLLHHVPADIAVKHLLVPIYVRHVPREGRTLYVAMVDPTDAAGLQSAADASGLPVKPMVASPSDVRSAVRVYYLEHVDADLVSTLAPEPEPPEPRERPDSDLPLSPISIFPSMRPPPPRPEVGFRTLTMLDGSTVRLPLPSEAPPAHAHGLTTGDLIKALRARAEGGDVSGVLEDGDVETLLAALLSVLLKKGLVADWEFLDAWMKHRRRP